MKEESRREKRRSRETSKEEEGEKKQKNKLIFHQMSARPDDTVTAATCVITLRTTDFPAAPTLRSRRQTGEET